MWGVAGLRVLRLANPVVRRVLDSRAHPLLSGRLVVLAYRGRRTGRQLRIPLRYAETRDGALVAVAVEPEGKQWWRTFADEAPAAVRLRGTEVAVRGRLAAGDRRGSALEAYLDRYPRSRRLTRDAAVVVLEPVNG
ncbi:MAG TPA: nitroreductase/quinone reductase family protein [Gaiella sp.]